MAITVADIEQKEFAFKGAGYDPYDVDQYLDQICDEMVAMQDRIDALDAQLKQARQDAEDAKNAVRPVPVAPKAAEPAPIAKTSEMVESILLNAQRVGDEAIAEAKKRADTLVAEAEAKARAATKDLSEEKLTLQKEIDTLHVAVKDYRGKFIALLKEQKNLLADESLFDDK